MPQTALYRASACISGRLRTGYVGRDGPALTETRLPLPVSGLKLYVLPCPCVPVLLWELVPLDQRLTIHFPSPVCKNVSQFFSSYLQLDCLSTSVCWLPQAGGPLATLLHTHSVLEGHMATLPPSELL